MTEKTACLIGKRNIENQQGLEVFLYFKIKSTIQKAIDEGYTHFITHMKNGFDRLATQALIEIKKTQPEITIECVISCKSHNIKWNDEDTSENEHLIKQCDIITMLSKKQTTECILEHDKYMIDKSSLVIMAFNGQEKGEIAQIVNYAKSNGVKIVNTV